MPLICKTKLKKAQHIVELALFAPFVIFFIGILTEIAIVINTNYKFNSALYEAVSHFALNNKFNADKEETVESIKEYSKFLLNMRSAPYQNSLKIDLTQTDDLDFLIGRYRYTSVFTLLNSVTEITPEGYNYMTIIPVNSAILRRNSFDITDDNLKNAMDNFYTGRLSPDTPVENETPVENSGDDEAQSSEADIGSFDVEIPKLELENGAKEEVLGEPEGAEQEGTQEGTPNGVQEVLQ